MSQKLDRFLLMCPQRKASYVSYLGGPCCCCCCCCYKCRLSKSGWLALCRCRCVKRLHVQRRRNAATLPTVCPFPLTRRQQQSLRTALRHLRAPRISSPTSALQGRLLAATRSVRVSTTVEAGELLGNLRVASRPSVGVMDRCSA